MVLNLTVILLSLLINRGNFERLNFFFSPLIIILCFSVVVVFFEGLCVMLHCRTSEPKLLSFLVSRVAHYCIVLLFLCLIIDCGRFEPDLLLFSDVRVTYYCIMLLLLNPPPPPPTFRNTGSRFPELWLRVRVPSSTQKRCV